MQLLVCKVHVGVYTFPVDGYCAIRSFKDHHFHFFHILQLVAPASLHRPNVAVTGRTISTWGSTVLRLFFLPIDTGTGHLVILSALAVAPTTRKKQNTTGGFARGAETHNRSEGQRALSLWGITGT